MMSASSGSETNTAASGRRTALVTGSSNGIGEAIVKQLARLDFKLVVTGRVQADIERVAGDCERLSPSGLRPLELRADLESEPDVKRLFERALEHFDGRLDLLVNNAGFSAPSKGERPSAEEAYELFKRVQQVNLNSAVYLTELARPSLEQTARTHCKGRPTSVILVSSIASLRPVEGDSPYCVSKAAMTMFANCMSSELAPLVRVNCIVPGPIETKIFERSGRAVEALRSFVKLATPLGRFGLPEEVAEAVVFLADQERASYITGAQLTIDGGTLWSPYRT